MKKPLLIWVSVLTLLTLSATLFAQTTTGTSLITEMKAAVRSFTLAADLNPGVTGLQSAPVWGKKTGDMLTAGEYNRILELVGQGGGGGGGGGGLKICKENDNCAWTPLLCWARSPDSYQVMSPDSNLNWPIIFWSWSNSQCGTSGTGWHTGLSSCSTGTGTWQAKCDWVLVDTGSGGGGGGSGWVDVSSTTTPFDLNCEYKWKIPNFRSTGNAEVFSASRINLTDISVDFSAGNYQAVSASNKRSSTGDHGTFAAQTFQRCDSGGGGTGGGPIVKQISGSTPPKGSNYIALCNDNTTVPTMNGYGPLPVYWSSTAQKWIGRRIEIPIAGPGATVNGYMFDCPSLWIAE